MRLNLLKIIKKTKQASFLAGNLSTERKNKVLLEIAKDVKTDQKKILEENRKDVERARKVGFNQSFIDRLTISDKVFSQMLDQVYKVSKLSDLVGQVIEKRRLKNEALLTKITVPLGVIGVIYESRPNVTLDASILALKSGNAVVLKGGQEAFLSNKAIVSCIHRVLRKNNLPPETVLFLGTGNKDIDRKLVWQLVKLNKYIDVIIPRGGYKLIKEVTRRSTIPLLYHGAGGARIYIDKSANLQMAIEICVNAKTNRPATCNSLDTIIVHKKIAKDFLRTLADRLKTYRVKLLGDYRAIQIVSAQKVTKANYKEEFLDLILAIKIVDGLEETIKFINKYSKRHSEGIIAEDKHTIKKFTQAIDSASIFVNCSTRLHDGEIFGLGAEMGIATGKLHARGPVGLKELTTYKWILYGKGQIRE